MFVPSHYLYPLLHVAVPGPREPTPIDPAHGPIPHGLLALDTYHAQQQRAPQQTLNEVGDLGVGLYHLQIKPPAYELLHWEKLAPLVIADVLRKFLPLVNARLVVDAGDGA